MENERVVEQRDEGGVRVRLERKRVRSGPKAPAHRQPRLEGVLDKHYLAVTLISHFREIAFELDQAEDWEGLELVRLELMELVDDHRRAGRRTDMHFWVAAAALVESEQRRIVENPHQFAGEGADCAWCGEGRCYYNHEESEGV